MQLDGGVVVGAIGGVPNGAANVQVVGGQCWLHFEGQGRTVTGTMPSLPLHWPRTHLPVTGLGRNPVQLPSGTRFRLRVRENIKNRSDKSVIRIFLIFLQKVPEISKTTNYFLYK